MGNLEFLNKIISYSGEEFFKEDPFFFGKLKSSTIDDSFIASFSKNIVQYLKMKSIEEILEKMEDLDSIYQKIAPANIPQFSSFENGTFKIIDILKILKDHEKIPGMVEVGEYLTEYGKKEGAYRKYGENHSKLAALLELSYFDKKNRIHLSELGEEIRILNKKQQNEVIIKLSLKIPIIAYIICKAKKEEVSILEELKPFLSPSTITRRKPNILCLLRLIKSISSENTSYIFNNIKEI